MDTKQTFAKFFQTELNIIGIKATLVQCDDIAKAFCAAVKDYLKSGFEYRVNGFGTFYVSHIKSRTYENLLNTGKTIISPDHDVVKFSPSKAFNDYLNGKS